MKSKLKKLTTAVVIAFSLVGAGGTVLAATGYVTWGGTENFEATMSALENIANKATGMKEETTSLESQLATEKAKVATATETLNALNTELANSNGKGNRHDIMQNGLNKVASDLGVDLQFVRNDAKPENQNELEQAEKDMQTVKDKAEEVSNLFE